MLHVATAVDIFCYNKIVFYFMTSKGNQKRSGLNLNG